MTYNIIDISPDQIVCLRWYPNTPVGFNVIYHYDINMAIILAIQSFRL